LLSLDRDRPQTLDSLGILLRFRVVVPFMRVGLGHTKRKHREREQLDGAARLHVVGHFGQEGVLAASFGVGGREEGADRSFN
jgi:hypothetical protein